MYKIKTIFILLASFKVFDVTCKPLTTSYFFRTEYKYIDEYKSFYKFHNEGSTWFDAFDKCVEEGSQLFFPINDFELNTIRKAFSLSNEYFVGMINVSNDYHTIDGLHKSQVYNTWSDDNQIQELCVKLLKDVLWPTSCLINLPFMCKKSVEIQLECEIFDKDYKKIKDNKCFKLHEDKRTWGEALNVCQNEGGRLAFEDEMSENGRSDRYYVGTLLFNRVHVFDIDGKGSRRNNLQIKGSEFGPGIQGSEFGPYIQGSEFGPDIQGSEFGPDIQGSEYGPHIQESEDNQVSRHCGTLEYGNRYFRNCNEPKKFGCIRMLALQ